MGLLEIIDERVLVFDDGDSVIVVEDEQLEIISEAEQGPPGVGTAVGNWIAFDRTQTLTVSQQDQACANIGVGDPGIDFVAAYNTAKV